MTTQSENWQTATASAQHRSCVTPKALSRAVEDYLKAIYLLEQQSDVVHTNALCAQLGDLRPGSVTGMLRRLAAQELVVHTPYRGVQLTPDGERAALALLRTHRLLETYLVKALGYTWDEVHAEAERLEHHISPQLAARIAAHLGDPSTDPHGDPIPRLDGSLPTCAAWKLSDVPAQIPVQIARVTTQDAERLRYLATIGLVPGAELTVVTAAPFQGPLELAIAGQTQMLDYRLAQVIMVTTPGNEP